MQVLTPARKEFFHQRHPQALRDSALDLPFDQRGIDGPPHIMRRGHFQHPHRAEFKVDFDLRHVGTETEYGVQTSLPVLIERTRGRIERRFTANHVSMCIEGQLVQSKRLAPFIFNNSHTALVEFDPRALARSSQLQNFGAQLASSQLSRLASYEGLPRRGGLAAIW